MTTGTFMVESFIMPREITITLEEGGKVVTFLSMEKLKRKIKERYLNSLPPVNLAGLQGRTKLIEETITRSGEINERVAIRYLTYVSLDSLGYLLTRVSNCFQDNILVASFTSTKAWVNNEGKMEKFPLAILRRYGLT